MTDLSISGCDIGDDGAKYIAESLKEMKNLETLDLSENKIGPIGAKDIAESLKELKKLKFSILS